MKSLGSLGSIKKPSNIEEINQETELTPDILRLEFSNILSVQLSNLKQNKPRKDKAFEEELNKLWKGSFSPFSSHRSASYNQKDKVWEISNYVTTSYGGSTNNGSKLSILTKDFEAAKKMVTSATNQEDLISGLKLLKTSLSSRIPVRYELLGKEFKEQPSQEIVDNVINEHNEQVNKNNKLREERQELETKLENYQFDVPKGRFLQIFIGKNIEIDRGDSGDMELMTKAMNENIHYENWHYDEYDGPSYSGSRTYTIKGKVYAIPLDKEKLDKSKYKPFDGWDLKKFVSMLEKDGYSCNLSSSAGSYGSRSHELTVKKGSEEYRFAHNSARQSFETSYLPNKLKGDDFEIAIWGEGKTAVLPATENFEQSNEKELTNIGNETVGSAEYTINRNKDKNGIELYFKNKPDQSVIDALKSNSFRWSFSGKCWYKKDRGETDEDIYLKLSKRA